MSKQFKALTIAIGAMILATVGVGASDVLRNIDGGLAGLVVESDKGPCPPNSVLLALGAYAICFDVYEASAADICVHEDPKSEAQTSENIRAVGCHAVSEPDRIPWRYVSLNEAQQLCARAGKRLPTNFEWYKAISGLQEVSHCAVNENSAPVLTGSSNCQSPVGVEDMVGNVWEWIEGQVVDGVYEGRKLPPEGYVALVDSDGVVTVTSEQRVSEYGSDYAWTDADGVRGMLRGGFYGSGEDAGLYSFNAEAALDLRTAGIGFRCVQDIR